MHRNSFSGKKSDTEAQGLGFTIMQNYFASILLRTFPCASFKLKKLSLNSFNLRWTSLWTNFSANSEFEVVFFQQEALSAGARAWLGIKFSGTINQNLEVKRLSLRKFDVDVSKKRLYLRSRLEINIAESLLICRLFVNFFVYFAGLLCDAFHRQERRSTAWSGHHVCRHGGQSLLSVFRRARLCETWLFSFFCNFRISSDQGDFVPLTCGWCSS